MLSPLYGQLSPLRVPTKTERVISADADVVSYILAVEAADGQQLEQGVITAVESFILGCKSDGIWSAIKASCILAGARTLNGALVPLTGTAPRNFNFVSGDYDRETGLKGNGSTKYLDSNRADNADPQNSKHASVFVQTGGGGAYLGAITTDGSLDGTQIISNTGGFFRVNSDVSYTSGNFNTATGLVAANRSNSTQLTYRINGFSNTVSNASAASQSSTIFIFRRRYISSSPIPTDARLQFYSIGESLDLAALDPRVSTLMTDLAAAIP